MQRGPIRAATRCCWWSNLMRVLGHIARDGITVLSLVCEFVF